MFTVIVMAFEAFVESAAVDLLRSVTTAVPSAEPASEQICPETAAT